MVPPPRHVYSAHVRNLAAADVQVKVTYEMPNNIFEDVVAIIRPNKVATFEQKIVKLGSATFRGHIFSVALDNGVVLKHPFKGVSSPVQDYVFEIHAQEGLLNLHEKGVKGSST